MTQPPQPADGAGLVEGMRLREVCTEVEEALARGSTPVLQYPERQGANRDRFPDLDDLRRIHRIVFGTNP